MSSVLCHSVSGIDHVLVGEEDQAYVGHHVHKIGGEALVHTPHTLISDHKVRESRIQDS